MEIEDEEDEGDEEDEEKKQESEDELAGNPDEEIEDFFNTMEYGTNE